MARSLSDIMTSFLTFLRRRQPSLELGEGTPENDLFIRAPAIELSRLNDRIEIVSGEQSIETASDEGADRIAANFTMLRKGSSRSRVTLRLFRSLAPDSTISVPTNSLVSTAPATGITPVQFRTIESGTMFANLGAVYLNPVTGKYEITVEAEAVIPGREGNVGGNTINAFVAPISGFDGVYNPSAGAGGVDRESTTSLTGRVSRSLAGSNVGTSDGYYQLIAKQDGVSDVGIVGNGESLRDSLGAIDIVVKGKKSTTVEEAFTPLDPLNPQDYTPRKQPIITDGSPSLFDSNNGGLTKDTNWEFVTDNTTLAGSVRAVDKVRFLTLPTEELGTLTLAYQYNSLIETLQSLVDLPQNKVHNTNVLVLWAEEIPVDITMNIRVLPGFDSTTVSTAVVNVVSQALADYGIGEEVQQSDIVQIVVNTPGVDSVQIPFGTFQSADGEIVRNSLGDLEIPPRSYAVAGTITVNPIS